ncbi:MAG: hypothetical protein KDB40_14265 [Acidimicrobiales bacterium]|nr:hypothetical protein [Acidimicrobiales bacterium]MCB9394284.1 hypothetical protein [Acidimicrobiaceae bacterium]
MGSGRGAPGRGDPRRPAGRIIVACDSGGHLTEAWALVAQRYDGHDVQWRTSDTEMARTMLAGHRVWYSHHRVRSRDGIGMILEFGVAVGKLVHHRGVTVVSTGSAYALPWMLAAVITRTDAVFVESAARLSGLSASGRAIAKLPGITRATQAPLEVDGWEQWESVLDVALATSSSRPPRGEAVPRVFVTVGTFAYPFDRLLRRVREVVPSEWTLVVQHGASDPVPGADNHATLGYDAIRRELGRASVVVAHLGVGTLMTALAVGTPIVAVPRRRAHGEVVDDHQVELLERLRSTRGVTVVAEVDDLDRCVLEAAMSGMGERAG